MSKEPESPETLQIWSWLCQDAFERDRDWLQVTHILRKHLTARAPIPEWAANLLMGAIERVDRLEVKSWDDIFGKPRRHAQYRKWEVHNRVMELRQTKPKPRGIFAQVAKEKRLSEATVKRWFEETRLPLRRIKAKKTVQKPAR